MNSIRDCFSSQTDRVDINLQRPLRLSTLWRGCGWEWSGSKSASWTHLFCFFFHQCTENSFKKLVSLLTQQDLLCKQLTQSRLLVLYTQEISTFVMQLSQAQNEKKKKKNTWIDLICRAANWRKTTGALDPLPRRVNFTVSFVNT